MNPNKLNASFLYATCAFFLMSPDGAAQTQVSLGTTTGYAIMAGSTITNTGPSVVTGDVGLSPGTVVSGFPPGTVVGVIRTAGAAAQAQTDLTVAYNDAAGRTPVTTVATELGGQTLAPGVYDSAAGTFAITGVLTLDGQNNAGAVFILKAASTLITAAGAPGTPASQVVLIRGAQACNVFWVVGSSATLGTYSSFQGTILASESITATTGAAVNGRLLAGNGAVTLDSNIISASVCSGAPLQGAIQVVKNTVNGNGAFTFTSNFGLTSLTTVGGAASQTFSGLTPGSGYTLSEAALPGWTQTSATCTSGTPDAITVAAGATAICTIVNTQAGSPSTGSIQVVKNTVNGNGAFTFTSNFGLTSLTTIGGAASQTFSGLTPGSTYTLTETALPGWTQTSASCTNGTPDAIAVAAGTTTVCTIVNTQAGPPATGSIQVIKNAVNGNGVFRFTSNFGLTSLTTVGGAASQTFSGLTPGASYALSETPLPGWTQTSASCTNGTPAAITVAVGVTTVCTIVNTQALAATTGAILFVKNAEGKNGTFTFTSNFGLTSLTTILGTASLTFTGLVPGSGYRVSEVVPAGWTQTSASCTNGTPASIIVVAGVTTICTITNTANAPQQTGSIQVIKNAVGGNGVFRFTSNFGITGMTTSGGAASQTVSNLTPGAGYSLSETLTPGWTQTSASCTNGTPAAIVVVAGATTTCTIVNAFSAAPVPDLTIRKSHQGDFRQGDTGDDYALAVTNAGQGPTTGVVTVSDILPAGLTATAIGGAGWTCALVPLSCTRADALAAGASYPAITVTVKVANSGLAFHQEAGNPSFQMGDILISLADGGVQWRRSDWTLVNTLTSGSDGQAKGLAFDSSGNLLVTHWTGSGSSGNNVMKFDRSGKLAGPFGTGYNCNPSSIAIDNSGAVYVGQADCGGQILKLDSSGNLLARYSVAVELRGSYHIVLDPNQCTMYYTSSGPNVKRFDVCGNKQMPDFTSAPLPDTNGGQQFSLLPSGGMLVANFGVIVRLDASGNLVRTFRAAAGNSCWLGSELDPDGASFWASDWCGSSVTRFDIATGAVMESHVADDRAFMVKQITIPGNIFSVVATNTAAVAGGGELNASNNSASDATTINTPAQAPPTLHSTSIVDAAAFGPAVAAGGIATVFGSNLALGQGFADGIPLPATLAGSSFQVGGRAAPLFYVLPTQVNLQIPWELAGQSHASVTATVGSLASSPQTMSLAPFAPGIFTLDGSGTGQGAVLTGGDSLIAAPTGAAGRRPARRGEVISIYCTGLGPVSNQPATGSAASPGSALSSTVSTPEVTIGTIAAHVSFSGLAPGAVGLYQVNVQVPVDAPAGDAVAVILSIGGVASNTVTIAVQ